MLGLVSKLAVLFNSKMIRKITRNLAWCDFVLFQSMGKVFALRRQNFFTASSMDYGFKKDTSDCVRNFTFK